MKTNLAGGENNASKRRNSKDMKNSGLRKCFSALVDRKQINLEFDVLKLMLRTELDIDLEKIGGKLNVVLPYLLVYYIKNWPGWQKSVDYYSGKISFKVWYEKFYKFITIKLNEAINTHYKEALASISQVNIGEFYKLYNSEKLQVKNTQTDNLAPKVLAPFIIKIMSKPALLNTLVFTDNHEGDVILKQHKILDWSADITKSITVQHIITWPHVGVHFVSPVFSFTRRNVHEYRRHISFVGTPLPSSTTEFIDDITINNDELPRTCFTWDYLSSITDEFLLSLGHLFKEPHVKEAFATVIGELLNDVEDIHIMRNNKPTMASNTTVLFNIGKCTYFRNKKLSRGSPSRRDISYTEVIVPKMETNLTFISDHERLKEYFEELRKMDPQDANSTIVPRITFSCSFCNVSFDQGGKLGVHLSDQHKMEQSVLCTKCKDSFPVYALAHNRWWHNCASLRPKK